MLKEILFLGIGGDGVQLISNLLSNAVNDLNYKVSNFYIYGSQVRGGESTVVIKISDEEIINPIYSSPDFVVVLNDTYIDKYKEDFNKNTKIIKIDDEKVLKNKNILILSKLVKNVFDDKTLLVKINDNILKQLEKKLKDKFENVKTIYLKG